MELTREVKNECPRPNRPEVEGPKEESPQFQQNIHFPSNEFGGLAAVKFGYIETSSHHTQAWLLLLLLPLLFF